MSAIRYAAQSFLDGFTSMSSIFMTAQRPGSEEPLFLPETDLETNQGIMLEVEHFLREVEPMILADQVIHGESQALLRKIRQTRTTLSAWQSST